MPVRFYLNDSLPELPTEGKDVGELFKRLVLGYKELHKNELLDLSQHWATSDYVDNVTLCSMTLRSLLVQLKSNPTLFTYASKLVGNDIPLKFVEEQLSGDKELGQECLCNGCDAHMLLVAQKLDMIAATLPVDPRLCNDVLDLVIKDVQTGEESARQIHNWHIENSEAIAQLLTPPLPPVTEPWNRLMDLLRRHGKVYCSNMFKQDWDSLGIELQQLIVQRFEDAINGGLLFPANNNNMNIVKQDQKDRTSKVHELRQVGNGFRVYFECDADAIYIALFGSKTIHHGKDQDADFRFAKAVVERMRQGIL